MAQTPFIQPEELEQYGLSWEFLDQFRPVPIEVKVTTAGALGTMQVAWRRVGDPDFGNPLKSNTTAPWKPRLSNVYADMTFPVGTYVLDSVYTVDEAGVVTPSAGGLPVVTATRFDLRPLTIQATTAEIMTRISDAVVPPLISWSDDFKQGCGAIAAYELKSIKGLAPVTAAIGDENLLVRATNWRNYFDKIGEAGTLPPGVVDSSGSASESDILMPMSDDPVGW